METPTKEIEDGLKSHRVTGLSEELTPSTSKAEGSKFSTSGSAGSESASVTSPGEASQDAQSGGVLGYVKSFIPGVAGSSQSEAAPKDQKLVHAQDLKDGTSAEIHTTTPPETAVPTSLEEGPGTVGAAKTAIQDPVSPYAGALEGIAGPPVASDPTAKFGPALGPLTGEAPAAGAGTGVVGAVSSAAATVVSTVKSAVGYESTETTSHTTITGPSTDSLGPTPGVVTPAELPKSAVVSTQEDGTAAIEAKQAPGYLASAAGAVGGGATYVKDAVTGLVGGGATSSEPEASRDAPQPAVQYEGEAPTGKKTPELVPASDPKPDMDPAPSQDSVPLVTRQPPVSAFAAKATTAPEITEEGGGKEPTVTQKNAQIVAQKETAAAKQGEAGKAATVETPATKAAEKDSGKDGDKAKKGCCGCVIS